jgi:hypothetical protein
MAGEHFSPDSMWEARKGSCVVDVRAKPGPLFDGIGPPPAPGEKPTMHPFLSGTCFGDELECSHAGALLGQSTSFGDFLRKLRAAGYEIHENAFDR